MNVWKVDCLMFVDDIALMDDCEAKLQELLRAFGYVCRKRKLKGNVSKNKLMRMCGNS